MKYPDIKILDLTLPIILQSTKLEGFHQDPADQISVIRNNHSNYK